MTFKITIEAIPDIQHGFNSGLRALGANSNKIKVQDTRQLNGSVDIDECTTEKYPNASRWDYVIGYNEKAYFVEVHPASTSSIREMLQKLTWLRWWLKHQAPDLKAIQAAEAPFRWVATGSVQISKKGKQARQLAQSGLQAPQKSIMLH